MHVGSHSKANCAVNYALLSFLIEMMHCSKVLEAGASVCVDTDAKYGGSLHIEALPDQQQVCVLCQLCNDMT